MKFKYLVFSLRRVLCNNLPFLWRAAGDLSRICAELLIRISSSLSEVEELSTASNNKNFFVDSCCRNRRISPKQPSQIGEISYFICDIYFSAFAKYLAIYNKLFIVQITIALDDRLFNPIP